MYLFSLIGAICILIKYSVSRCILLTELIIHKYLSRFLTILTGVLYDIFLILQIGTRWENVVEKIVRSRYQPLLLIYSNPAALPVTTETAPSTRVMAPGYSITPGKGMSFIIYFFHHNKNLLQ